MRVCGHLAFKMVMYTVVDKLVRWVLCPMCCILHLAWAVIREDKIGCIVSYRARLHSKVYAMYVTL